MSDETRPRGDAPHSDCVPFLRWALPRLGLAWPGFRRVHRQVCKRVRRRIQTLDLAGYVAYRAYLEAQPSEWPVLDSLCRIPISRFYRDADVFAALGTVILPALAEEAIASGRSRLTAWSAGCASGEEPYSLALLWRFCLAVRFAELRFEILATDADPRLLARAAQGCYPPSCLRELPLEWRQVAFVPKGRLLCLEPSCRASVTLLQHDVRAPPPAGPFDLVLCRNLAFTYFDDPTSVAVLRRLLEVLRSGGALVAGRGERLPSGVPGISPWLPQRGIYRRDKP